MLLFLSYFFIYLLHYLPIFKAYTTPTILPNTPEYFPWQYTNLVSYAFSITDDMIFNIYISMYSFNGNSEWTLLWNKVEIAFDYFYSYDNKQEYFLVKSKNYPSLLGDYVIRVRGLRSGYVKWLYVYNINPNEIPVDNNEIFLTKVNFSEDLKVVFRRPKGSNAFLMAITAVNCQIKTTPLTIKELPSHETHNQYIWDDAIGPAVQYEYMIKLLEWDNKSIDTNEYCRVYCVGYDLSKDNEIILSEGIGHTMLLSGWQLNKYNTMKFKYIFYELISNTLYFLVLNPNEGVWSFEYEINENNDKSTKTIRKQVINDLNQRIVIPYQDWDLSCKSKTICPIHITLNIISETSLQYKITIVPLSREIRPIYLTQGNYFINGVSINDLTYYYTSISGNNNYEAFINFQRGSGNAIAKLVPKKCIEMNPNWNRRAVLPTNHDKIEKEKEIEKSCINDSKYKIHYLPFDYINSKFVITSEITKTICFKGCEWYLGINSGDTGVFQVFTYAVFIRSDDNSSVVSLPMNESVFGSLDKTQINSYRTKINKKMDEVIIDFKTGLCNLFVNIGMDIPSAEKHDLMIPKSEMYSIAEDSAIIKDNKWNGKTITFSIKCLSNSYYTFKIIDTVEHMPTIIKINTNSESTQCHIEEGSDRCFLLIKNNNYERFKNIRWYAYVNKKLVSKWNDNIEIYVNLFEGSYLDDNKIMNHMPTETGYQYSSLSNNEKNQLSFEWDLPPKENRYILITVKMKPNIVKRTHTINLMPFFQSTPLNYYPNPNRYLLFILDRKSQVNFRILCTETYLLDIIMIEGEKGTLSYDKYELQWGNDKKNKIFSFLLDQKTKDGSDRKNWYIFSISGRSNTNNLVFILHYSKILNALDLNQIRKIHYSDQVSPVSMSFYSSLNSNCENDVVVNLRFNMKFRNKENDADRISFHINGIVTNEYITQNQGVNEGFTPEIGVQGWITYIPFLNIGRVLLSCNKIQQYISNGKYMFWTIKSGDVPKKDNEKTTKFDLDWILIPSGFENEIITIEEKSYYFGYIEYSSYNTLRLPIANQTYHFITIEYSSDKGNESKDYDIAIVCTNSSTIENNEILKRNKTDNEIVFEDQIDSNKKIITLKLRYHAYCYFTIFRSVLTSGSEQRSKINYLVKYAVTEYNEWDNQGNYKNYILKKCNIWLNKETDKSVFTFSKIGNWKTNTTYIFRVTNQPENWLYLEEKGEVLYEKIFNYNETNDNNWDDENISVEILDSFINYEVRKELYAHLLVIVYDKNDNENYDLIHYKSIPFDHNVDEDNSQVDNDKGVVFTLIKTLFIILSAWLSLIWLMMGIWVVYRKIRFKQIETNYMSLVD